MQTHDEIHPYLRRSLSAFLDKARPLSWAGRAKLADAALASLTDAENLPAGLQPILEFPKIMAAMILDAGAPPVTGGEQAICYSLSVLREHREAGEDWLEAHPEEAERLEERALATPTLH